MGAGGVEAGTGEAAEEAEADAEIDVRASAVEGCRDGVRVEAAVGSTRDVLAQCHQSSAEPAIAAPAARPSVRLPSARIRIERATPNRFRDPLVK